MDYQQNQPRVREEFYAYVSPLFSNIAVGGAQTQNISIQNQADFMIQKMVYFCNIANATLTDATRVVPNLSVLLTDTGSGKQLMNVAVPVASLFGEADKPFILPKPYLIRARSVLQIQVTNFDAAVATHQLYLSFLGVNLFTY